MEKRQFIFHRQTNIDVPYKEITFLVTLTEQERNAIIHDFLNGEPYPQDCEIEVHAPKVVLKYYNPKPAKAD